MDYEVSAYQTFVMHYWWVVPVVFAFCFGACAGSLANVLVYRMPLGKGLVFPPSACPHCQTVLTWRENIPIVGWVFLRGKCRFCKSPISPEYPIVELITATLFAAWAFVLFGLDRNAELIGLPVGLVKPEWAISPIGQTWPLFIVFGVLFTCLVAMLLIDARTCYIPLPLPWACVVAGLVVHTGWGAIVWAREGQLWSHQILTHSWAWSLPTPLDFGRAGWWWFGAAYGGAVGLGVSLLLLRLGLIRRSFEDYDQWEEQARAEAAGQVSATDAPGAANSTDTASPADAAAVGDPYLWVQYPHARREMVKELAFLAPIAILAWVGGTAASAWAHSVRSGGGSGAVAAFAGVDPNSVAVVPEMPLPLAVLAGVILGYLIGGGVLWAVRVLGSVLFGKEALGMGDVHMMAGVGACLGFIDSVLAFFLSAFVGLGWFVLSLVSRGRLSRAMPLGPHLAVATMLVLATKPLLEWLLTRVAGVPADGLPINLP